MHLFVKKSIYTCYQSLFHADKHLCGNLSDHVKVSFQVAPPEATHTAPDLAGEAGAGDAVEHAGNGSA